MGIQAVTRSPTTWPTPARAKTAPSAASICGSNAAQPTVSISLRPSCSGLISGWRSRMTPTATAMTAARAREISVACLGSSSGTPPTCSGFSTRTPKITTRGRVSAGMNSFSPNRSESARRSCGVVVAGWPRPSRPKPAISARPRTRKPLPRSPSRSPARKLTATRPQKAALPRRLGLLRSVALRIAKAANISPARR